MKSIIYLLLFVLFLTSNAFACDYCLVAQGISPLETFKGAGIRINERYLILNRVYHGTDKLTNPGDKEEFWTTEFTGFYGVTEDIILMATIPVRKTSQNGELHMETMTLDASGQGGQTGLGDVSIMGRYSFFKKHTIDSATAIAGLLGIKFPTGKTNGRTDSGADFLDSHMQLGTGSVDPLVGLSLSHSIMRFSLSANLLGIITTEGKAGDVKHQFGNTLNYDLTAKYRVYPTVFGMESPQIFLAIGFNGETTGGEKEDGVKLVDSGGSTVYLSPGVQVVVAPRWIFELSYQDAIYHNLYGTQPGPDYRMSGGITYLF